MNEDALWSKLTRFFLWIFVLVIFLLWIGILLAPLILPTLRRMTETEYAKFKYKEDLVKETMATYTKVAWGCCIVGWILTIIFLARAGL